MQRFARHAAMVLLPLMIGAFAAAAGIDLPQDKGPDTLDVSRYPAPIRNGYALVTQKCGKCHTLARVLNTTAGPRFWGHYVGNLQKSRGIALSDDDAIKIYDFLIYDQVYRKDKKGKAFYPPLTEEELARLSGNVGEGPVAH
jgi:hypothetical protein